VDRGRTALTTTFRPLSFEADDWLYVKDHLPGLLYVEDVRGIVAIRNGRIGGMHIFDHWTRASCVVHLIISDRRVLVEGFLEEAWGWVFGGAKRAKVYSYINTDNVPSMRIAKRIGVTEVARLVDSECFGVDQIIFETTKESCGYV
jgi:hypothetical protein